MIAFGYEPANVGHPPSADASAVAVRALAELVERHERIGDLHRMLAPGLRTTSTGSRGKSIIDGVPKGFFLSSANAFGGSTAPPQTKGFVLPLRAPQCPRRLCPA